MTNRAPSATGHDQNPAAGVSTPLSQLFSYSDPDVGDSVTAFAVKDRTSGGGYLTNDGVRQTDGQLFDSIPISQISHWSFVAGSSGATDQIGFNAIDGHGLYSSSATANVVVPANRAPSATGHDQNPVAGTSIPLSQLFTYSDPDAGDSVTAFAVKDRTSGGGYLTKDGVRQTDGQLFDSIQISQISHWAFVAGTSGVTDQVGFNAIDSHGLYSSSVAANVTVPANNPPSAIGHDQSPTAGTSIPLSQLFTYSDPDAGDSVTAFAVKDRTSGGGYLTKDGVRQTDGQLFDSIPISQLSHWSFVAGSSGVTDQVGFNAIDSHGAYSSAVAANVTVPANNSPSATGHDQSPTAGTSIPLSQLFTYSDPDAGDSVTAFAVKDRTSGGGYLTKDGVRQTDDQLFDSIPVSQISHWAFVAGSSGVTDQVGFNAIDSHGAYSSAVAANVTVPANSPPSATGHDQSPTAGTSTPLSQLFSYSDPDAGDSVTAFAVKDRTSGGGYLTKDGVRQTDGQLYDSIPISQISHWSFVAGNSGVSDQIGFNAIDSHGVYSSSASATVAVAAKNHPPVSTAHDQNVSAGTSIPLSQMFTYSDPDSGDSVASFAVKDRTVGNGHLTKDGVIQTGGQLFDAIPISQISHWAYVAGPSGTTDTIGFNAIDSHGIYSSSVAATVTTAGSRLSSASELLSAAHGQIALSAEVENIVYNQAQQVNGIRPLTHDDLPSLPATGAPGVPLLNNQGIFINLHALSTTNLSNAEAFVGRGSDALFVAFHGAEDVGDVGLAAFDTGGEYQLFSPLIAAIDTYVSTHPEIKHVYLAGHSLGGAVAEKYMADHAGAPFGPGIYSAVTFGSVGYSDFTSHQTDSRIIDIHDDADPLDSIHNERGAIYNVIDSDRSSGADDIIQQGHEWALYDKIGASIEQLGYNLSGGGGTTNISADYDKISGNWYVNSPIGTVYGSTGNDTILAGNSNNTIHGNGGDDHLFGGPYNDEFDFQSDFNRNDQIHGGIGTDTLALDGDYSQGLTFAPSTMDGVEEILVSGPYGYKLTTDDQNVAAGQNLIVDASALLGFAGSTLTFNGSNETDGHFRLIGGSGADKLTGGAQSDVFIGGGGADTLTGGSGPDYFVYTAVSQSNSFGMDTITDFNATEDRIDLALSPNIQVNAIDNPVTGFGYGAIGSRLSSLEAHHAVLYEPTPANVYLVVDSNGAAGYQAGSDLLIHLVNPAGLTSFGLSDFVFG